MGLMLTQYTSRALVFKMEYSRNHLALMIAMVVVLVIAVIAAFVFGIGWFRQKEAIDAVCADLVGAEAKHVSDFLRSINQLRVASTKSPAAVVPVIAKFLRESYGVNAMYQNVAAYCPSIADQVQARMAGHTAVIQQALALAQTDPEAALAGLQSHLQAHAASLRAYLKGVGSALGAAWIVKTGYSA